MNPSWGTQIRSPSLPWSGASLKSSCSPPSKVCAGTVLCERLAWASVTR